MRVVFNGKHMMKILVRKYQGVYTGFAEVKMLK